MSQYLRGVKRVPEPVARHMMRQLAAGLQEMWAHHLVHVRAWGGQGRWAGTQSAAAAAASGGWEAEKRAAGASTDLVPPPLPPPRSATSSPKTCCSLNLAPTLR